MNKRIKRQFWLSPRDNAELKRKSKIAKLNETAVIRLLIRGYEPREKPDEKFFDAMRELSEIGNSINRLVAQAKASGSIYEPMLRDEISRWHKFQADVESVFLRPNESNLKWK